MSIKIDANEFLRIEAAEKLVEVLACTGDVDLTDMVDRSQALALADRLLASVREQVADRLFADACLLSLEEERLRESLDAQH